MYSITGSRLFISRTPAGSPHKELQHPNNHDSPQCYDSIEQDLVDTLSHYHCIAGAAHQTRALLHVSLAVRVSPVRTVRAAVGCRVQERVLGTRDARVRVVVPGLVRVFPLYRPHAHTPAKHGLGIPRTRRALLVLPAVRELVIPASIATLVTVRLVPSTTRTPGNTKHC